MSDWTEKNCPRLIEVALPIREISAESVRDKSLRHGLISTLHLWWARRPLAASRAVVFASLVPDPDDPQCPGDFRTEIPLLRTLLLCKRGPRRIALEIDIDKPNKKSQFNVVSGKAIGRTEGTKSQRGPAICLFCGQPKAEEDLRLSGQTLSWRAMDRQWVSSANMRELKKRMEPLLRSRSFWNWRVKLHVMQSPGNSVGIISQRYTTFGPAFMGLLSKPGMMRDWLYRSAGNLTARWKWQEGMGFLSLTGPDAVSPCFQIGLTAGGLA